MKKLTIAVLSVLLVSGISAFGQGTIFFANRLSSSLFAPVYMPDGTTPVSGAGFSAQLYADIGGSFTAIGSPLAFRTGAGAGSWAGIDTTVNGIAPGASGTFQVRVWDNNGGAFTSFASALAAGRLTGISGNITSLPLGGGSPPATSPNIVGNPTAINNLQPFSMQVPEPSTIALGLLGAAALLLRRRK